MTKIFCSTGGAKKSALDVAEYFLSNSITNIELSGGIYDPKTFDRILDLQSKGANFLTHNYFPVPKESFVLNLASQNSEILNKSIDFLTKSIIFSKNIGSKIFAVHAGFLVDPSPNEIGKSFNKQGVTKKSLALEIFLESITKLYEISEQYEIQLYVENNVISKSNFEIFGEDIFLMTTFNDFHFFINEFKNRVRLLLDIGHLKVSCETHGLDKLDQLDQSNKIASGYHLHDNFGFNDDHLIFDIETSWFAKNLKRNMDFVTLEVHEYDNSRLRELVSKLSNTI